jgi:hypothetical protein
VLEKHYAERAAAYEDVLLGGGDLEETASAVARFMLDASRASPPGGRSCPSS